MTAPWAMLVRAAEVEGTRVDVRVGGGRITEIGRLDARPGEDVLDADGGALLPGLHDHHVHLLAAAAVTTSVDCGPAACAGLDALARAVTAAAARAASGDGWVRGTGYHESVAGPLDRRRLDQIRPDGPVRIQHRSGALWMLNSAALALVLPHARDGQGVERDADGEPTGRLWRRDDAVRAATAATARTPDLAALGRRMRSLGLTGVTDATPDLDAAAVRLLASAVARGDLPARLHLLGAQALDGPVLDGPALDGPALDGPRMPRGLTLGPRKIVVTDHDLPAPDELTHRVRRTHAGGRAVAVHCVSRVTLVLALAAIERAGPVPGDRIEHAAVVPPELAAWIARLRVRVVTQPCLPAERGDEYLAEVEPVDRPHLYPYASLLAAGVPVAPSSDAPYASLDPWAAMAAAADRCSPSGARVGRDDGVPPGVVLAGYLSPPDEPGGAARRIVVGAPDDLCLLHLPLAEALAAPSADVVRAVFSRGVRAAPAARRRPGGRARNRSC